MAKHRPKSQDAGWLKRNGLSLAMLFLFSVALFGQIFAGHATYNADQQQHNEAAISVIQYLTSGHFIEAVFENWESEFLQMATLVVLSAYLYQKGAPDSRKLEGEPELDADPQSHLKKDSPRILKRGPLAIRVYENSLGLTLFALFIMSFILHAYGGAKEYSQEELQHGGPEVSMLGYIRTSRFWFESFQNWQSEFLSVAVLLILSIYLRQRRSPQSKPVAAPHSKTGG